MATYYVRTSSSGGDGTTENDSGATAAYASLSAAEDARDSTLSETMTIYCSTGSGTTADTTAVSISGWNTYADKYLEIKASAADRPAGAWSDTKYRLYVDNAVALTILEDYVRVDGLQIGTRAGNAASQHPISISNQTVSANAIYLSNLIVRGHTDNYSIIGILLNDLDMVATVWNCVVYSINTLSGSRAMTCTVEAAGIYGCTFIGGQYGVRATSDTGITIKNTYIGGSGTEDFYRNSGTLAKVNCASEDQSADDTSGTDETATDCVAAAVDCTTAGVTFVDPANGDFRIADTDSALYGAGATLSDDPPGSTALGTDIAGTTRS